MTEGKLGTMHVCRDEDGRVLTDVGYDDVELAAMPIPLRNEYLDACDDDLEALVARAFADAEARGLVFIAKHEASL